MCVIIDYLIKLTNPFTFSFFAVDVPSSLLGWPFLVDYGRNCTSLVEATLSEIIVSMTADGTHISFFFFFFFFSFVSLVPSPPTLSEIIVSMTADGTNTPTPLPLHAHLPTRYITDLPSCSPSLPLIHQPLTRKHQHLRSTLPSITPSSTSHPSPSHPPTLPPTTSHPSISPLPSTSPSGTLNNYFATHISAVQSNVCDQNGGPSDPGTQSSQVIAIFDSRPYYHLTGPYQYLTDWVILTFDMGLKYLLDPSPPTIPTHHTAVDGSFHGRSFYHLLRTGRLFFRLTRYSIWYVTFDSRS